MDRRCTVVFEDHPLPTSEDLASQDGQRPPRCRSRTLPELDWEQLRQLLLLDLLQPGTLHWEHGNRISNSHIFTDDDTKVSLSLTLARPSPYPSVAFKFLVVVGVDGAWSCMRRPVSLAQPTYMSVTCVEIQHTLGDANESTIDA
jgi:hypothetical protein